MSEETIVNVMEFLKAAADEAGVDVEPLYVEMARLRPASGLSMAIEDAIAERALRRGEGMAT